MRILVLDTAGARCAAAVWRDGRLVATRAESMTRGHAEHIMPMAGAVLAEAGVSVREIARIAVCTGPGGFTGARIGVAAARGLALATGSAAAGVDLFEAAAAGSVGPTIVILPQAHGRIAFRRFNDGAPVGGAELAERFEPRPGERQMEASDPADLGALARVAAARTGGRPAPLYLRPPDAARPREGPPPLLT